jgi:hypothetical protein
MISSKNLITGIAILTVLSACEKQYDYQQKSAETKSTVDYPYEIYEPATDDPYAEMKSSLIHIFNNSDPNKAIDLNKTVFLLEAGLSALFEDYNYVNFDGQNEEGMAIEFTKNANFTTTGEVKANFTQVFNMIENTLNNNSFYSVDAIDIRFESEDASKVYFTANVVYAVNGSNAASANSNSSFYWGTVPNAPYSAFAGTSFQCPLVPGTNGAYENVTRQVRSVAPMNHVSPSMISAYYNNYFMSTNPTHVVNRRLNGDYLVGAAFALDTNHRGSNTSSTICIPVSNVNPGRAGQNEYAQAVVDHLHPFLGKHNYWGGLISFRMYNSGKPDLAIWNFDTFFGAVAVTNQTPLNRTQLSI